MKVEIWSDIVCPFCYIGKRRLEAALANFEHADQVEVVWKSFQLNPNQVTNPNITVIEDLAQKKGWTLEYASDASEAVADMAAEEGLVYDFEKAIPANTFKAHRLLQFAKTKGLGSEMKEALLHAYFLDGKNVDDTETLAALAASAGLPDEETKAVLKDEQAYRDAVMNDIAEARQLGVSGVPFFVINRKYGISGAQPLSVFSDTLAKVWAETAPLT
jgi:predicted DsbA family dithiol-disulfide isomerase